MRGRQARLGQVTTGHTKTRLSHSGDPGHSHSPGAVSPPGELSLDSAVPPLPRHTTSSVLQPVRGTHPECRELRWLDRHRTSLLWPHSWSHRVPPAALGSSTPSHCFTALQAVSPHRCGLYPACLPAESSSESQQPQDQPERPQPPRQTHAKTSLPNPTFHGWPFQRCLRTPNIKDRRSRLLVRIGFMPRNPGGTEREAAPLCL